MRRRAFVRTSMGAIALSSAWPTLRFGPQELTLAGIEKDARGRLGVSVLDVATGRTLAHRADERFAMCSTFKWLLAAHILWRVDQGSESLAREIRYTKADLLDYAPVTKEHVDEGGLPVAALCDAAVRYSDNTAANLLLAASGGPGRLTQFARRIRDSVTRLDRNEPDLNSAEPGDERDTTSPAAMVRNLRAVLLGDTLTAASRSRLTGWLVGNTTGIARLRAGLPPDWRVGDKTGTGAHGSTNDVAIAWRAPDAPVLIAAYLTETDAATEAREAALARVGRVVSEWVAH